MIGRLEIAFIAVMAIALQIQVILPILGYSIRVGFSDLFLPIFYAVLFWRVASGYVPVLRWKSKSVWVWLGGFTLLLVVSVVNGYLKTGTLIPWAVLNKGLGWFVLLGYFLFGAWVASRFDTKGKEYFLKVFIIFTWVTCLISSVLYAVYISTSEELLEYIGISIRRIEGFAANPNAFGALLVAVLSFQLLYWQQNKLFSSSVNWCGASAIGMALLLTGSRAAWVVGAILLVAAMVSKRVSWVNVFKTISGGAGLCLVVLMSPWLFTEKVSTVDAALQNSLSNAYFFKGARLNAHDGGTNYRLETAREAIDLWLESPILGSGLGVFIWNRQVKSEQSEHPAVGEVIHSTPLWVLTEIGLLGLVALLGLFFSVIFTLWRQAKSYLSDPFYFGVIAVVFSIAIMSVAHELLYQRYLWAFLGMALASFRMLPSRGGWG